jgi:hypothetical protein
LCPAQAREAPAEGPRDSRRKKGLDIVQAVGGRRAARGVMNYQKTLPATPGRAGGGIVQQICFRRKTLKYRHGHSRRARARGILMRLFPSWIRILAVAVVLKNQLGKKKGALEIGQRITEALRGVHAAQSFEIGRAVFADAHERILVAQASACVGLTWTLQGDQKQIPDELKLGNSWWN